LSPFYTGPKERKRGYLRAVTGPSAPAARADNAQQPAAMTGSYRTEHRPLQSGSFWMQYGVDVYMSGDFQGAAFTLDAAAP